MIIECCEVDYRKYEAYNYSGLKLFAENPYSYYNKYILKQKEEEGLSDSVKIGMLVDCLLLEKERFNEKFSITVCDKPVGQMGDFIDELWVITQRFTDENGVITVSMKERLEFAFDVFKQKNPNKFKGKDFSYVVENFRIEDKNGNSPELYYINLIKEFGKITVDQKTYDKAEKIVNNILNGKYTNKLFLPSRTKELKYQTAIVSTIDGVEVKGLIDIIEIDHTAKTVLGIDLKTTWQMTNFSFNFKKMGYYLQASLYHSLLSQYIIDNNLTGYTVDDRFMFLICDSTLTYLPHFYICSKDIIDKGLNGFSDSYTDYKGVKQLIKEIEYCRKNGFYDHLSLHENNGFLNIKL